MEQIFFGGGLSLLLCGGVLALLVRGVGGRLSMLWAVRILRVAAVVGLFSVGAGLAWLGVGLVLVLGFQ